MFQNLGLHVVQFPSGRFGYVGSIPAALGEEVEASNTDVMGGRAFRNAKGDIVTMKFPAFDTREEAVAHAAAHGFTVQDA